MRILAVVSYKGTNYAGWQKQPNALSIQEVIEDKLSQIFNRPISIYGAGRTDAGVHALGQRFHFDIDETDVDLDRLIYSLNSMLPVDIKIDDMEEVDTDFHARYNAKEKIYSYSFVLEDKDVFLNEIMYVCPYELDIDKLEDTLTHFKGKHNFKNFTSKDEDKDNFVREIYDVKLERNSEKLYNIVFRGNGFMRYMIRYLVGTAIEVARGKVTLEEVDELFDEDKERHIVSWKAPANGLLLLDVIY